MKVLPILVIVIIIAIGWNLFSKNQDNTLPQGTMRIISTAFLPNQPIPKQYTCEGRNISPPLRISSIPEETKSIALIMDDPDAPVGTWVHWVLWNIEPVGGEVEIKEDSVPSGAKTGITSFGEKKYGGPCPPTGMHRYFFKVYALDISLDLALDAGKKQVEQAIETHTLDFAELIGTYERE